MHHDGLNKDRTMGIKENRGPLDVDRIHCLRATWTHQNLLILIGRAKDDTIMGSWSTTIARSRLSIGLHGIGWSAIFTVFSYKYRCSSYVSLTFD